MPSRISSDDLQARAVKVRLACFDVDGTLTDGRLGVDSQGGEFKTFHVHDGLGLKLLRQHGIDVAIITARSSPIVAHRAAELGIERVCQGCTDKRSEMLQLAGERGLTADQVCFMGDDLPDLSAMLTAGLAAAPADAHAAVAERAHWLAHRPGGGGAARELADLILSAQGHAASILARFGA